LDRARLLEVEHGSKQPQRVDCDLLLDDADLVAMAGIAERGAEEEPIELRLREGEGSLLLDRVLRREHEERVGELTRDAVDRHLLFGHALEERGLRLRHRAVDLVDEDDVREDRAGTELEVAVALVEDREPGDVRRLEVGCALHACERRAVEAPGDRPREHGLGRPGHVLEQDMAPADESGEHEPDLVGLAVDDGLDIRQEAGAEIHRSRDPLLGHVRMTGLVPPR
jgi:hypothetical protein